MNGLGQRIRMMDEGIDRVGKALPGMPAGAARLGRLLLMTGAALDTAFGAQLKPHKLNHSEFLSLMFLYSQADGCATPGELCDCAAQGATNMTRIASALVKRGLVTRGVGRVDRRRVEIRITANGRRFVQKMLPTLFPPLDVMVRGFTASERATLDRLLRKLATNIDSLPVQPDP